MAASEPPELRLRLAGCEVRALGTIAGFVPDGERVAQAFDAFAPDHVALGIPPEDLAPLRLLAATPEPARLIGRPQEAPQATRRRMSDPGLGAAGLDSLSHPRQNAQSGRSRTGGELPEDDAPISGLDHATVRFLELLRRFGATRVPSPDLETAFSRAVQSGLPVAAIDLDDEAHSTAYTQGMKVRHLLGAGRRERRLLEAGATFADAADPYEFARRWDAAQNAPKPLAAIERLRERHMATRLRDLAAESRQLLAIVPATRLPGIAAALGEGSPDATRAEAL